VKARSVYGAENVSVMQSYQSDYEQYLADRGVKIMPSMQQSIAQIITATNWDNPSTALDCNNIAVMALIEADRTDDLTLRGIYLETSLEALANASEHPLGSIHWAIVQILLGNTATAQNTAFNILLTHTGVQTGVPKGLIFLPHPLAIDPQLAIIRLMQAVHASEQAIILGAIALLQSQSIFYNSTGQRFLTLAGKIFPESPHVALKQGIGLLMCSQWEGWLDLHRAASTATENSTIQQRIQLAIAIAQQMFKPQADAGLAMVPFDGLQMAIEPNLQSIVTGVLLGAEDWFEAEMEFWRSRLSPGMTVIDVGANAGVYTFSAAQKVGPTGRVIAIEPFSGCVNLLNETIRLNALSQVHVCHGAASERSGKVKLSLRASSELNEISDADLPEGTYEEVEGFTLDSLIDTLNLTKIDFLKIDAEGHEIPVLKGSDRLLREFRPVILYENIAGIQGSNLPVAEFLQQYDYEIHIYKPYIQEISKVQQLEDIHGNLNVIAVPKLI
jgi:FkbM family methyltransferase